jgi:D-sedoheptulose 7-phosphate isomerase
VTSNPDLPEQAPPAADAAAMPDGPAGRLFALREAPALDFADQAGAVADACHAMAVRFHQGGKLITFGTGGSVTGVAAREGIAGIFAHQIRYLAEPSDIALGICADGDCPSVLAGLRAAKAAGLLTIALAGGDGGAIAVSPDVDHVILARSADPRIVKEMQVTAYHVLWELVHVFFEQPGVLAPGVVT